MTHSLSTILISATRVRGQRSVISRRARAGYRFARAHAHGTGGDVCHASVRGAPPPGGRARGEARRIERESKDLQRPSRCRGGRIEARRPARGLAAQVPVRRRVHGVQLPGEAAQVQEGTREDLVRPRADNARAPSRERRDKRSLLVLLFRHPESRRRSATGTGRAPPRVSRRGASPRVARPPDHHARRYRGAYLERLPARPTAPPPASPLTSGRVFFSVVFFFHHETGSRTSRIPSTPPRRTRASRSRRRWRRST